MTVSPKVYSMYGREDSLCQSNGFFSLNLTEKSIPKVVELLDIQKNESVAWIGCGDGRELLTIAREYPDNSFIGIDINDSALDIAKRVLNTLQIKNVELHLMNAFDLKKEYSIVYSTAIYGPELYMHLHSLAIRKLCMLRHMWSQLPLQIPDNFTRKSIHLSGSKQQLQLVCAIKCST